MRFIDLHGSGGPKDEEGKPNRAWLEQAKVLTEKLEAAKTKEERDRIVDDNQTLWRQISPWLLSLSHGKCWYSEAADCASTLAVEHFRPKKSCKRVPRGAAEDGYWWLTFDWTNYRICGGILNSKKREFFPLAQHSGRSTHGGLSEHNEIPLLLDPASPRDPALLTFDEDGSCGPHADAGLHDKTRVLETRTRLNLNHPNLKKARQRVWRQCWELLEGCRSIQQKMHIGPGDNQLFDEKILRLRELIRPSAPFSATAKDCLLKSNISWALRLAGDS